MVQQNKLGKSWVLYLTCMQQWISLIFFTITENNTRRINATRMFSDIQSKGQSEIKREVKIYERIT